MLVVLSGAAVVSCSVELVGLEVEDGSVIGAVVGLPPGLVPVVERSVEVVSVPRDVVVVVVFCSRSSR